MKRYTLTALALALLTTVSAFGSGMLIPKDASLPPLAIKHQRVDIQIKDGVATAKIEQVFKNNVNRDLEAVFVFPLPENAAISDFAMFINGKRMSGELVEKDKARKIYQDIVRRMKDPGLLEYLGGNLFRISVYPVPKNGEQRIELEYSQTLPFDGGLYKFVYPLKTGERASRTLEDFTTSVRIHSATPIKNVYSPSHEVGISRKGEHEAMVGFEEDRALLDRDFVLYYSVSKKAFGMNVLTHAVKDQDGFYMLMLAPSVTPPDGKPVAKDVLFVFDTSGSMAGQKIEQARGALTHCVQRLNEGDRFNIIRFSTDSKSLADHLLPVNKASRAEALTFVDKLTARGGTAIDEALAAALKMDFDPKRPRIVVFLTDGKPTIGESDPEIIAGNVADRNSAGVRLFVFGVGEKVNTHLLDKLSGKNGGLSQYVLPGEDIEIKVSSLVDKLSNPVLANVKVEIDKIKTNRVHPRELPDLFCGDQLVVLGRYEGSRHTAIRLLGDVEGAQREFVYEGDFPATNSDNAFIPRLWATRRVGYLLDAIRLQGEEAELKDEVMWLSKEYGIMTPYTSYLVLEDDKAYVQHGIDRDRVPAVVAEREERAVRMFAAPKRAPVARPQSAAATATETALPMFREGAADALSAAAPSPVGKRMRTYGGQAGKVKSYLKTDSGAGAIDLSRAIARYKRETVAGSRQAGVRHVGKRIFYHIGEQWVDSAYRKEMKTRRIEFASDAYFKLLADHPELKRSLALGRQVIVVLEGQAIVIETAR
ncbi:MAG: VWA domain-containing protein [Kiritimatiellae bacterium]|nr:VWA domain-containing protein [Kiritimatiellia bacterium]